MFLCTFFSATPAKKYNSRNNRGEVVVTHGPVNGVKWEGTDQTVTVEHYNTDQSLSRTFKYMFQKLSEKFRGLFYFVLVAFCLKSFPDNPNNEKDNF